MKRITQLTSRVMAGVLCPECKSDDTIRAGINYARVRRQRWRCKSCGHLFLGEQIIVAAEKDVLKGASVVQARTGKKIKELERRIKQNENWK